MRQNYKNTIYYIVALLIIGMQMPNFALGAYSKFNPGEEITLGEFVYEDDFTPSTDDCTITVKNPSGVTVVNEVTMSEQADGWHYYTFTPASTAGIWPAVMTCGSVPGGDLVKADKTFEIGLSAIDEASLAATIWGYTSRTLTSATAIAADIWGAGTRTLTSFGSLAADVWNDGFAPTRRLTDSTLSGGGTITTESFVTTSLNSTESDIITEVIANRTLINALNNISAADVWAYGSRSLNTDVDITTASQEEIWDVGVASLTTVGSVGKLLADNLDAQVSSRGTGTSTLTAADVWNSATRNLTDYSTSSIATAVWANAARTLTNYGNDITAAEVWEVLSSSLDTVGTIGNQLSTNIDVANSDVVDEILTNRALINALNDISAADVWAYGSRSLNTDVDLSTASQQEIWDVGVASLTSVGSVGKLVADNLDAQVSSRGTSNLTAADVWSAGTRTLTDNSSSTIAAAVWANGTRTLTNYGNDITAADVWNVLSSTLTTVDTIGQQLATNIDVATSTRASLTNQTAGWTVSMSDVDRQMATKIYRAKVTVLNHATVATTPFATPTINIYDADRNLVVSGSNMTAIATGVYEYTYTVPLAASQGLWESVVTTQVENGKNITTNDYWEVTSSPAQVIINDVTDVTVPTIAANVTITNEGLTGYEYDYEWCVVTSANNPCGGGNDTYYASAAKFINPGEDFNTTLSADVSSSGDYLFKLVVYFGNDNSKASRTFTATGGSTPPPTGGGGGGGGGGSAVTPPTPSVCNGADFNNDKNVNSIDFSIMLAFWKTNPPFKNPCVDINTDAQVNSIDFSILLYQWGKK